VAEKIGITFQQIQKYENGVNRVSVSRLLQFSLVLDQSLEFFCEAGLSHLKAGENPSFPEHMIRQERTINVQKRI
jgi:transcriptional regulator with XRE-family HTH domain